MGHETLHMIPVEELSTSVKLALVLIPALPLSGFIVNGMGWLILKHRWPRMLTNVIAVAAVFVSFILSLWLFAFLKSHPEGFIKYEFFTWIAGGGLDASFGLTFDRLSAIMCLVVTGVGGVIHLYSTGYMGHDPAFARYFAYLNLFTFAMLVLVMGSNIALMFVGWEGVGFCSYILIGFWYEDDKKASAGKKAFIVNRIGDFGFLVGIFTVFWLMGTLDINQMAEWVSANSGLLVNEKLIGISIATFIALALFIGATGKSAQIPLYVWLPDAMAGPTPVSALIHAATMVTAGVYMIGRLNFIYVHSPVAMMVVAAVGVLTALYSATIAFTQFDIKKVLAYSTISQLGFMFTAMGMGAFTAGIFHLVTHAFFKALLFLGAGAVIHELGEQDMRKMGGLAGKMPVTFITMAAAWLAISGFFGFSGFISKDEILWKTFASPVHTEAFSRAIYTVGLLAAACTAVYMTRLIMLTFLTPSRMDPEAESHVHECPWNMSVPLIILAVFSVIGGVFNWPHILGGGAMMEHWLEPMWHSAGHARGICEDCHGPEMGLMMVSFAIAVGAILAIYLLYRFAADRVGRLTEQTGPLYRASLNKYWVDEIYDAAVVEPFKFGSYFVLFRLLDVHVIDGAVNGLARLVRALGRAFRLLQTGEVQTYIVWIVLGALAILTFYMGLS